MLRSSISSQIKAFLHYTKSKPSIIKLSVLGAVLAVGAGLWIVGASQRSTVKAEETRPNIVFIFADDLERKVLEYMPNVKSLLSDEGVTFDNYIYNIALCCPSRATMLTGEYAHNTKVYSNEPENGGYAQFYGQGNENSTVPIWLKNSGYKTGYFGKYFNGYVNHTSLSPTYVPPGWDDWFVSSSSAYDGFDYRVNNNGTLVNYGTAPQDYSGDTLAAEAQQFLQQNATSTQPFYMTVAPYAPHTPYVPAPRHANLFSGVTYPKSPNFNEADVSDKLTKPALLTQTQINQIDINFRKRIQAAQSVDETVAGIVNTLQAQGKLDNTIIVFTSDNGYHMGEHRLAPAGGKHTPYEEDIRVPLIIRGPGIPKNVHFSELVGNVDIAPTFADAAGVTPPAFVDGRSLLPLFDSTSVSWRHNYLMQRGNIPVKPYHGLRTDRYTYVEYDSGSRELYDLQTDPYQLNNYYKTAPAALKTALQTRLAAMKGCKGDVCRAMEEPEIQF